MSRKSHSNFLMGTVIGGTLAAMAALFFTTKKGHKMQRGIIHKCHDMENTAKRFMQSKIAKLKAKRKDMENTAKHFVKSKLKKLRARHKMHRK